MTVTQSIFLKESPFRFTLIIGLLLVFCPTKITPQSSIDNVYLILDASGSMWGKLEDGSLKINAAKEALKEFVQGPLLGKNIALRAYGHNREKDCSDTQLIFSFTPSSEALEAIESFSKHVTPTGRTPIGRSLKEALQDIGDKNAQIILISDGLETCDEDPCELVRLWNDDRVDIQVHVVGLGLQEKEKEMLECVSEAAGTAFVDVHSLEDLTLGLGATQREEKLSQLRIRGINEKGERVLVHCKISGEGFDDKEGRSDSRYWVPEGKVQVLVGIKTLNGILYKPTSREIYVSGNITEEIAIVTPPEVKSVFFEDDKEGRGVAARVVQEDGTEFTLRPNEWHPILPGSYTLHANLDKANQDLTVSLDIAHGERKEAVFKGVSTIRTTFYFYPAGSQERLRFHTHLYQNGELKYKVHSNNGADIPPGVYDAHLQSSLTPYIKKNIVVGLVEGQIVRIDIPVGHVTFRYQDVHGKPLVAKDKRIFVLRKGKDGKFKRDRLKRADIRYPLMPGSYQVSGWSSLGSFDDQFIEVIAGDEREIVLKSKE